MKRDTPRALVDLRAAFGDVVRLKVAPGMQTFLVAHPAGVQHVLQDNQRNYVKSRSYRAIAELTGRGLLTSDGDHWLRHRRLAQQSFYRERLAAFVPVMADCSQRAIKRWESGDELDISAEMMRLTLTVAGETLFSTDLSGEGAAVGGAFTRVSDYVSRRLDSIPGWMTSFRYPLPTLGRMRFKRGLRELDRVVYDTISRRRGREEEFDDLLSTLATAREADEPALDDHELRDEVMTFLLAGHETTANALGWTWYLLALNPDARDRLTEEIDDVLGGRTPSHDDLDRLVYTGAVVREVLRLYPPAWAVERETVEPDEIGGHVVPKGAAVMVSPFVTHRHPDFWADPETFEPDRFLQEGDARHRFAFLPFGGGRRQCIGGHFALMEATVVVATVAQRFHCELVEGARVETDPEITLRARFGIPMRVVSR
jgi:cytochrome P450